MFDAQEESMVSMHDAENATALEAVLAIMHADLEQAIDDRFDEKFSEGFIIEFYPRLV